MELQFICSKCNTKVFSRFLNKGEEFYHRDCGGKTIIPENAVCTEEPTHSTTTENRTSNSKNRIKGCPQCDALHDNNSRFCTQCGYELNPPELVVEMVCEKCGTKYSESKKYCPDDGTKLIKQKTEISDIDKKTSPTKPSLKTKVDNTEYSGFTHKLSTGGYGLFKTYWLFNVLIGAICSFVISLFESFEAVAILTTLFYIYGFIVLLGIWNAANKYNGLVLWAILAKISSVISLVVMIVSFIYMLSLE